MLTRVTSEQPWDIDVLVTWDQGKYYYPGRTGIPVIVY
jgi:hypothetical protein